MYQAISKHNAAPQSGVQPNLDWSVKQGFVVGISTKYNPTYAAPPLPSIPDCNCEWKQKTRKIKNDERGRFEPIFSMNVKKW